MMFFQNAKKADGSDESPSVKTSGGGKKRNDLSKLIDESVPETALMLFQDAPNFATVMDGERMSVGLMLSVDRIGGLDKKASRTDPDKGQFLECIKNDVIQVYVTPEMLENDCILFIPTTETLEAMGEYSFLRAAPYTLTAVDSDGGIHTMDAELSLLQASQIGSGEMELSAFTGVSSEDAEYEEVSSDNGFALSSDTGADGVEDDTPFEGDSYDAYEDVFSDSADEVSYDDIPDIGNEASSSGNEPDEPEIDSSEFEDIDETQTDESDEFEESGEPVFDEDIGEDAVRTAFSRRFYSDDLGLEVSIDPFDVQFMRDNPVPAFSEDYDDQWLSGYLRRMAKDANLELRRMHANNISRLRENYFNLMARSCEDIQRTLDINDPKSPYGKKLRKLDERRQEYLNVVQDEIVKQKAELDAEYEKKREQYVENAIAAARQQYDNMYGRQHAAQVAQLEPAAYNRVEAGYQDQRRQILQRRRDEAGKLLDYRISDVMQVLTDEYRKRLDAEEARFAALRKAMQDFLDRNRKDEVTRVKVLSDELARNNKVAQTVAEYKQRMDALAAEHAAKKQAMEAEIQMLRRQQDEALRYKDEEFANKLADAQKQTSEMKNMLDEANRRYYELDERKDKDYETRMAALKDQNQVLSDKMTNIVETHKRTNTISAFLVVAILVAALAIGFIGGQWMRTSFSSHAADTRTEAIVSEYERRMDELEKKYGVQTPASSSSEGDQKQSAVNGSNGQTEQIPAERNDTLSNAGGTSATP